MAHQVKFFKKIILFITFLWTLIILVFVYSSIVHEYKYAYELALTEAKLSVKKDLAYRSWVASHGGVYVPITKRTQPNPYLSHIFNRDVNTSDGQQLTLMNPAYTLSQMMKDYSELYGIKGHITSKILMNPKNKPDIWEEKALNIIEKSKKPFYEKKLINNKEYIRYIDPLVTQKICLKCHAFQGYKTGDIRGAVSVSIPLEEFVNKALSHIHRIVIEFIFIWSIGLFLIYVGYNKLKNHLSEKIENYEQHIFTLVEMIEQRDSYTAGHTKRVAKYAVKIAKQMGYSDEKVDLLYRASMLHDIGKISTPDSILLKPGKLTNLEHDLIKQHVVSSYKLLVNVDIYGKLAEIVRHHHERYDGSGYPAGLKGEQIPMLSYIMAAADSFDAMTTDRIYKGRKSTKVALEELKALRGTYYHSEVINAAQIALKSIDIDTCTSQLPKTKLEKERFAYFYKDLTTNTYNRDYLQFVLSYNGKNEFNYQHIYAIYLHHFTQYNKVHTWHNGDKLLMKVADVLNSDLNDSNDISVFRLFGDDFIIMSKNELNIKNQISPLDKLLKNSKVTYSFMYINNNDYHINSITRLEKLL